MNVNNLKKTGVEKFGKGFDKHYDNVIDQKSFPGSHHKTKVREYPEKRSNQNLFTQKLKYMVEIPLPGWEKDNIHIMLRENVLTVKGKIREFHKTRHPEYIVKEHYLDEFVRSFELTSHTDKDRIKATFINGMLRIQLLYTENANQTWPRKIIIE